jgi:OFA family oxalate/formate antiporter-like MFS transporter
MVRHAAGSERWLVLAAGFGVMTTAGAAFSWSLYTRPLMAFFGWSSLQVALAFSFVTFFVGVGAICGGFLHDRFGPRRVALLGAILWGAGSILAGSGIGRLGLWWLYLSYGAIGGIGCGIMYVVPGATVTKWFPEERGLANGIILCGFGSGSLIFNLVAGSFPAFARVADAAGRVIQSRNQAIAAGGVFHLPKHVLHADVAVIAGLFFWSGIIFLCVGSLCALVLHPPPAGYSVPKAAAKLASERDFTPREMLRTRAFYMIWTMIFVNAVCGLALFSNAVPIYGELTGLSAAAAAVAFGWLSAANGVGRFLWAWLSDGIGRRPSLAICFAVEGVALFWIAHAHGPLEVGVAFVVVLLCFGGIFGITPAVMADFFGTRFLGEDYSLIITASSVAGLVGPLLVAVLEDVSGSLTAWLTPIAVVLIVTTVLPLVTHTPETLVVLPVSTE